MPRNNHSLVRAVASALIDNDSIQSVSDQLFQLLDELGDYVCTCEHCDELCSSDDTSCVDDCTWCRSCVDSDAYYWESDREYHSEPDAEETDDCGIPAYHDTEIEIPPMS